MQSSLSLDLQFSVPDAFIDQQTQPQTLEEEYADQLNAAETLAENITGRIYNLWDTLLNTTERITADQTNTTLVSQEFNDLYLRYESVQALIVVNEENQIVDGYPGHVLYLLGSVAGVSGCSLLVR